MEKIRQVPVDDIVKQYETLRELVKKHATEDQVTNILSMFDDFEERITSSPASGRLNYHNCFVGGFLDHVLRALIQKYFLQLCFMIGASSVQ